MRRLGLDQLVEDLLGEQVLPLVVELAAAGEDLRGAAHHLDVQRGRFARRERDEGGRVAVPVAQVAVHHAPGVVLHRPVVAAAVPLLLEALGQLVDVVDLVDRHALVGQVQDLVVHVGVEVALAAEDLLDAFVAPARPVVRGEQHLGLPAEQVERLVDVLRPGQGIADQGAAERVDVVQGGDDVLRHPERLHLRDVGVHLRGRLGVRRVLEDHPHAVDLDLLDVLLDDPRRGDQAGVPLRDALAEALADDSRRGSPAAAPRTGRTAAGSSRCRRRRSRRRRIP